MLYYLEMEIDNSIINSVKKFAALPKKEPKEPGGLVSAGPISVSMKAFIRDKERLLVVRDKPNPDKDHWSDLWEVPGGRIRVGESPEAVLIRKIEEEIGVSSVHLRVHFPVLCDAFVNPAGSFIVLVGWHCTLLPGAKISLSSDLSEWEWAEREALEKLPFGVLQKLVCYDYWQQAETLGIDAKPGRPDDESEAEDWPVR